MRLLILSDLHFEFHRDGGEAFCQRYRDFDDYDVAVIAGDLCSFSSLGRSFQLVSETFKETVYVSGNHEAYGSSIEEMTTKIWDELFEENQARESGGAIWPLERGFRVINGQRFIGATLWFPHDVVSKRLEWVMNDFSLIRGLSEEVDKIHRETKEWLWDTLTKDDVLVTHHLPHPRSIHPKYAESNLNRFFLGDIGGLIQNRQPKLVIHGHTHESIDYRIGKSRVVCNPHGYLGREVNPNFVERLVVEV